MEIYQAIVLGIVQGLTEFLPISSSGHLILLPYFLNWETQNLAFDIGLHFGTALAVILFFINDWKRLIFSLLEDVTFLLKTKKASVLRHDSMVLIYIMISILPVGIIGILFQDIIEEKLRSPLLVAAMMIIVAFVMFFAEKINKSKTTKQLTFKNIFLISLSQIIALIPGVSRSGITISTGLFLNLSKYDAAKISFLLATPVILGAALIKTEEIISLPAQELYTFIVGMISSVIVGLICIQWLLTYLKNNSLLPFIIYRIFLGALILVLYII